MNGVLANSTPFVLSMAGAPLPCTLTLKSTSGGRLIEVSTDGGVDYITPTLDITSTPFIVLVINAPVTHVRFTGSTADTWSVQ